jgi:hypothetical protein
MPKKADQAIYSKKEAQERFEAALRGSRIVGPNPPKTVSVKRGRPVRDDDSMPTTDAEALIAWGKRNIQRD